MRFVFVSTMSGAPWGGSEELWGQSALRLREAGHRISASVNWCPQLSPKVLALEKRGIDLFIRNPRQNLPARLWHKARHRLLAGKKREFQWLRLQKPDLVVISQGGISDGVEWMDFCLEAGLPYASIIQCNGDGWYPDDDRSAAMARAYGPAKEVFYQGSGCNFCSDTGYKDRIGIYELLVMTPEIKRLIVGWATQEELRALAVKQGMRTLSQEAINLVAQDITSVAEVIRSVYTL